MDIKEKRFQNSVYAIFVIIILHALLIFGLGFVLVYIIYHLLFANSINILLIETTEVIVIGFLLIYISKKLKKSLKHLSPQWYLERRGWKRCDELPDWIFKKFYIEKFGTPTGHGWTECVRSNEVISELVHASERCYFRGRHFEYLVGKGEIWRRKRKLIE